jgi:Ca-activated chloride channel homolog
MIVRKHMINVLRVALAGCLATCFAVLTVACSNGEGEGDGKPGQKDGGAKTSKVQKDDGKAVRTVGVDKKKWKLDPAKMSYFAVAYHNELATVAKRDKLPQKDPPKGYQRETFTDAGSGKFGGRPRPGASRPMARMPAGAPMAKMSSRRAGTGSGRAMAAGKGGGFMAKAEGARVGVTAGGMQDIGQARRFITEGKVPYSEMVTVEGLMSEHDIPLEGLPTGKGELYGSASVAWTRRYGHKQPEAMVQIGFGLDMELAKFKRKPLNLAVVVDISGSMRSGNKMNSTKTALRKLVDQLGEKDRLAIVLFNYQATLLMPSAPVKDKVKIKELVNTIKAGGGTCIEAGMDMGYKQVAAHLGETGKSARVFLLTDARPNIGAVSVRGFTPMMQGAAAVGIGVTAFGVGIDFGQQLAYKIFQVRGANYFYLENAEKIGKVFDDEFDFMVTPVAYDITIELTPAAGATVGDVLGVPDYKKSGKGASIKIPSLFLSKRGGGGTTMVAIRMKAPTDSERKIADIRLGFVTVRGEQITQKLIARLPGKMDPTGKSPFYSQPGAKKAVLLADLAIALKTACRGRAYPSMREIFWNVRPEPMPGGKAPVAMPVLRRKGGCVVLDGDQARKAAEGLGKFADWFASQIADVDGVEKELRLIEKLESTLRKNSGMKPRQPRKVTGAAPAFPPEVF